MKMNKLIFLAAVFLFAGCTKQQENKYQIPKTVTITGNVLNLSPEKNEIDFIVNRPGFSSDTYSTKPDSLGNFLVKFESYTPTDVWVQYKMNFLVLIKPGDSINIIFDGSLDTRPEILKSVKYSGNSAKLNHDAAVFQMMYYSNSFFNDLDAKKTAIKKYGPQMYTKYLDTMKHLGYALFDKFDSEAEPGKDAKIWARTYIEEDYYEALALYPMLHKMYNQLPPGKWDVPPGYYDPLKTRFPINDKMLISGFALSNFIQQYHINYTFKRLTKEKFLNKYTTSTGSLNVPKKMMDSLRVFSVLKNTSDELMRQMELTFLFATGLETNEITFFEKYSPVIEKYIKEPFLKEPLIEKYIKVKDWNENPKVNSNALLRNVAGSAASKIMDSIFAENKGKVIYLDYWATWCGACIAEFPYSKNLMNQLEDEDVVFVFMCLESEEKGWKSILSKYQLGGQHYLLTQKQSRSLRKALEIEGIPFYMLIDREGDISEKGSHLRPKVVKAKIEKLLN